MENKKTDAQLEKEGIKMLDIIMLKARKAKGAPLTESDEKAIINELNKTEYALKGG